jgi:hypothetical protein
MKGNLSHNKKSMLIIYFQSHVHGKSPSDYSKKLSCDMCSYSTSKRTRLREHITAIHFKTFRTRDWTCDICDKSFYEK